MQTRRLLPLAMVTLAMVSLAFLAACGSSSSHVQPSSPTFTSVPVTAATQGAVYTYQLAAVDPAGGTVTFSLTTSPTGAALSGSTVTWTPTAAQSRVSNSFAVTATTTSGGTAAQSWTVTPGGTITVNWQNNYWTATGAVQVPALPSAASNLSAMWTNPDGSITVQKSSATSPGVFSIPNVPGGYYWLQSGSGNFWTSASTFDAGQDIAGPVAPEISNLENTRVNFDLSGLDAVGQVAIVNFVAPVAGYPGTTLEGPPATSETWTGWPISPFIDWSQIDSAFLLQYVPESLGSLNNLVIGPSIDASISFTDGTTNNLTETLQPSPQASFNLSVPGSQWATLFNNAAPATPSPGSSALFVSAEQYLSEGRMPTGVTYPVAVGPVGSSSSVPALALVGTTTSSGGETVGCLEPGQIQGLQAPILTDQNFGALQYGDPFPSTWTRAVYLCQLATVAMPIPDSATTATFSLIDSASVAPSANVSLAPVVSIVQNPTINGTSFFTAATLNTTEVPSSWTAPTGAAPYGYMVHAYILTTVDGTQVYATTSGSFFTANTSITLPPLAGGNTYVFAITAEADGTANIETGPFRSSLPTGSAIVVSAPITISSSAQMPEIHGDRRVITRLSQAQPAVKGH